MSKPSDGSVRDGAKKRAELNKSIRDARAASNKQSRDSRAQENQQQREARGHAGRDVERKSEEQQKPVNHKAEALREVNKVISSAMAVGGVEAAKSSLERGLIDVNERLDALSPLRKDSRTRDLIASLTTKQQAFAAALKQASTKVDEQQRQREKQLIQTFPTRLEMQTAIANSHPTSLRGLGESPPSGGSVLVCKGGRGVWTHPSTVAGLASSIPAGTIVPFSVLSGETLGDLFNVTTGLGSGRWAGWALCDGQNGTPNLKGRFIVGYNGSDSHYNAFGNTGGFKWHGLTENNHAHHSLKHTHDLSATFSPAPEPIEAEAEGEGEIYAWLTTPAIGISDNPVCISWSGKDSNAGDHGGEYDRPEMEYIDATTQPIAKHAGDYGPSGNTDTDNRPPYYTVFYAMKLSS